MIAMCSHVGHVKDLPQGLITAIIHLHHVSCGEAVLVPLLGCLRRQMEKKTPQDEDELLSIYLCLCSCCLPLRLIMETLINSGGSFPSGKVTPTSLIWMKKPRPVLKPVRNGKPWCSPSWLTSPVQQYTSEYMSVTTENE